MLCKEEQTHREPPITSAVFLVLLLLLRDMSSVCVWEEREKRSGGIHDEARSPGRVAGVLSLRPRSRFAEQKSLCR